MRQATLAFLAAVTLLAAAAAPDTASVTDTASVADTTLVTGATLVFNRANAQYASGDYEQALALYNSLSVINPDLEYNRAAAYLKAGKPGKAALHFNRALRLRPGDGDTLLNLAYIRSVKADREPQEQSGVLGGFARRLVDTPPLGPLACGALAFYYLAAMIGVALMFDFGLGGRRALIRAAAVSAALALLLTAMTAVRINDRERADRAVAVAETVDAYAAPSADAEKVFTFHEGTEAALGRVEGNYVFVTLSTGYSGWADRAGLERI